MESLTHIVLQIGASHFLYTRDTGLHVEQLALLNSDTEGNDVLYNASLGLPLNQQDDQVNREGAPRTLMLYL